MTERWSPGIGDPDVISWLTVAAYGLAAIACGIVAWRSGRKNTEKISHLVPFWGGVALLLLALGINKELDLQSLLTQTLRDAAMSEGWYAWRRFLQAAFIFALALLTVGLGVMGWRRVALLQRNMMIAAAGVILICAYIIIRAASFHHVALSITQHVLAHRWIWPLEFGGIAIVFYAAMREIAAAPPTPKAS